MGECFTRGCYPQVYIPRSVEARRRLAVSARGRHETSVLKCRVRSRDKMLSDVIARIRASCERDVPTFYDVIAKR